MRAALEALVATLPRCQCGAPATQERGPCDGLPLMCDEHADETGHYTSAYAAYDLPYAVALRAAVAALGTPAPDPDERAREEEP